MSVEQLKPNLFALAAHDPVSYFQACQDSFETAVHSTQRIVQHCTIAGRTIALNFAGTSLLPYICPALEHLFVESVEVPDLSISLWDSASTGSGMPSPPWNPSDYGVRGEIIGFNNDRISTCFRHGSGAVSLLDARLNHALFWVPDVKQLPYWEQGAPLLTILHWWMEQQERLLVHAAAVGNRDGAALIVGRSGSGKSTTSLACLSAGLLYLGDDYTIISSHPSPSVHSLYNTAKVDGNHLKSFPHLLPQVSNHEALAQEKALLFLNRSYETQMIRDLNVRAILLPKVTGQVRSRLTRTSAAAALTALAPSTIFQLPRAGESNFKFLARFVSKLPCYALECGTDLPQIPKVVVSSLSRADQ